MCLLTTDTKAGVVRGTIKQVAITLNRIFGGVIGTSRASSELLVGLPQPSPRFITNSKTNTSITKANANPQVQTLPQTLPHEVQILALEIEQDLFEQYKKDIKLCK